MGKAENAVLVPGSSVSQFVIQQLLAGIEVRVDIDGKTYTGHVHQLDFRKGADYVFANVFIEKEGEEEPIDLRVSIHTDGTVNIMPN